jgi:hypothetical protein
MNINWSPHKLPTNSILNGHFLQASIPDQREPEFGFMLENNSDYGTIYNALATHPNIRILGHAKPENKFLISFAEDTVDEEGYPTRQVRALNLERRRRLSLHTEDNSFRRYDISFKDADKTPCRREWEQVSDCLKTGDEEILKKIQRDIPAAHILNPDSFRVSSICITSRTSYEVLHILPKQNAAILYEICNDACVFTNPHADRIDGFRKEGEIEAKKLMVADPAQLAPAILNSLLDESTATLEAYLSNAPFIGRVAPASISKVCHANEVVRLDYERDMPPMEGIMNGNDWSLLQNVRAWDFMSANRREALARLAETVPSPKLLVPGMNPAALDKFFPNEKKYPLFPDPSLKC